MPHKLESSARAQHPLWSPGQLKEPVPPRGGHSARNSVRCPLCLDCEPHGAGPGHHPAFPGQREDTAVPREQMSSHRRNRVQQPRMAARPGALSSETRHFRASDHLLPWQLLRAGQVGHEGRTECGCSVCAENGESHLHALFGPRPTPEQRASSTL